MDKIISLSKELKELIDNEEVSKEYMKVKSLLENNEELEALRKEIVKYKNVDKAKYDSLKERYDNHPIIINYNFLKEELLDLLKEVKDELEIKW